ncbi:hypothetical protein JCM21531_3300 [Acetivibrio straminisolvens JCM 21531]|uniref:Uncharacterized protein n=1 Tax=Acetivibrio straminisolvens JCM 21531 TaxID=1294263 RepID=W4VAG8_9FIRM|nr:hypothetical protein JCM21531_3300 [Acetivibrio straminisolvens JCM 21531]
MLNTEEEVTTGSVLGLLSKVFTGVEVPVTAGVDTVLAILAIVTSVFSLFSSGFLKK